MSLLAVPLSGCLDAQDPVAALEEVEDPGPAASQPVPAMGEPVTVVTDPEGDATEHNSDRLRYAAPCATVRDPPPELGPAQCAGYTAGETVAGDGEPTGGLPAHPSRDALAVRFQETPASLIVELDIAALASSLEGAADRENREGTRYLVSWIDGATGCVAEVGRWFWPHADAVSQDAWMYVHSANCPHEDRGASIPVDQRPCQSNQTSCAWGVPGSISYGEPATLRWEVPRDWLAGGAEGDALQDPAVRISTLPTGSDAYWAEGPASVYHAPRGPGYLLDRSDPGRDYRFQLAREPWPLSSGALEVPSNDTHVADPPSRPDLLIETLRFEPRADRLVFALTMARVDEDPEVHDAMVFLNLPGQRLALGAYYAPRGEWTTWATLFRSNGSDLTSIPVDLAVHPGSPGQLVFEVPRDDLLPIAPEARVQSLYAMAGIWNETTQAAAGHLLVQGEWPPGTMGALAPLHALGPVDDEPTDDSTVTLDDPYWDVEMPMDMVASSPAAFDLIGAQLQSQRPGEMRFTLSVADLSSLEIPPSYDAVLYAVAAEHERGSDMVGYYRSADQASGIFFCAPDVTVFADEPAPPAVSWTQISGRVSTSSAGGATGGETSSASAVLMFAPSDCFSLDSEATALNVTSLKAGSYVIRRATVLAPATVETLDTLESEGGLLAAFAQPVVEQEPFWSEPFGVENFWDILGLIVAVVTVFITLVIFLRRRRTFHRYLDEIRHIQETYRHDATTRATALVQLRRELHDDLERHRISDAHYPIVLDRLRARLTSARLTSLGQRFYDVPTRISLRIERLLDDGYLAEEEAAVLEPVIQEAGLPSESTEALLARLHTWVEEDRHEVVA